MLSSVFKPFVEKSPILVMARGVMERVLNPDQLNEWFDRTAEAQYTKDLLFSSLFDIMTLVVLGSHRSVHAAYQASEADIGVFRSHRFTTSSTASKSTPRPSWSAMPSSRQNRW